MELSLISGDESTKRVQLTCMLVHEFYIQSERGLHQSVAGLPVVLCRAIHAGEIEERAVGTARRAFQDQKLADDVAASELLRQMHW